MLRLLQRSVRMSGGIGEQVGVSIQVDHSTMNVSTRSIPTQTNKFFEEKEKTSTMIGLTFLRSMLFLIWLFLPFAATTEIVLEGGTKYQLKRWCKLWTQLLVFPWNLPISLPVSSFITVNETDNNPPPPQDEVPHHDGGGNHKSGSEAHQAGDYAGTGDVDGSNQDGGNGDNGGNGTGDNGTGDNGDNGTDGDQDGDNSSQGNSGSNDGADTQGNSDSQNGRTNSGFGNSGQGSGSNDMTTTGASSSFLAFNSSTGSSSRRLQSGLILGFATLAGIAMLSVMGLRQTRPTAVASAHPLRAAVKKRMSVFSNLAKHHTTSRPDRSAVVIPEPELSTAPAEGKYELFDEDGNVEVNV